uniref:Protein kinase A catalytic subunit n=1 Tax=Trypanosoma vivax (strain Y486) TaxID=1055687 RepID=G0U334_TRYVY
MGLDDSDAFPDSNVAYELSQRGSEEAHPMSMQRRVAEWRTLNTKRHGYRTVYSEAVGEKDEVPPEYLRKLVKDNGDLSGKRFNTERKLCVALLKYMPLALYKLLENMPMPWEEARYVNVVYHMNGILTLVDDTPMVPEQLYLSQWGSMWTKMRAHKVELQQECGAFRRAVHKGNENEPPIDYGDYIMDREPPPALYDDLVEEDAAPILDWFYDPFPRLVYPNQIRGPRRPNGYYFTIDVVEALFRNAAPILPTLDDRNYYYLWDLKSFYAAKAMHVAIPRAPRFEAPPAVKEEESEWTEFNDLRRVIHRDDPRKPRFTMLTERQIAFPYLYSDVVDRVTLAVYRYPAEIRVENDDPVMPCFSWNPSLNAIKAIQRTHPDITESLAFTLCSNTVRGASNYTEEEGTFQLPDEFAPLFEELPLEDVGTKQAIALSFAPYPFNEFEGGMKRRVDIPVAEHWCRDPPTLLPSETHEKTLRSCTQLLKHHVSRNLKRDRLRTQFKVKDETQNTVRPVRRLDDLANLKFFQKTKVDWLEAGLQLMRQGHNMLVQLINVKSLPYVHINYNFEAKPTRTLTTKEIKKSRLGPAFHLIRELLGFMKQLIDMHAMYRLGKNDAVQLADAIHYLFTHVGRLTGIYRYKLRAMRQIKRARDLKHVLYSKFNVGEVLRGPGCGFWAPSWRVWVFFLRGMTPLLQRYLGNLTDRVLRGRESKEQARIEEAFNSPHETLSKIVDCLARVRRFKNVEVEYMDNFSNLYPIYNVVPSEKLVDAFLDQYLWYEAMDQQRLFPNWVKPSDVEPVPILVYKWCQGVNDSPGVWDVEKEESTVLLHANLGHDFYDNVDWNLFRPLLELIMDKSLAEYIVSRHDVVVEFKDMACHWRKGLLRGFMFSSFLAQYWGLVVDVLLLGTKRSQEIAGPAKRPNPFMTFMRDPLLATSHPIRGYCRYMNEVYVLLRYTKVEADDVRRRYLESTKEDPEKRAMNASVYGFKTATQWPRDARMRLFLNDVNLARSVLWEFQGRLPVTIAEISDSNAFVSVYSKDNPNLLFDMGGFSVRLLPVCRAEEILENESTWNLQNSTTKDVTARAMLQVAPDHVVNIRNKARRAIMMVGSSTFQSIAAKWNALITEIVPYYREAILGTENLQQLLARAEHRMQSRIMMALNSRAKARFPPVMFYAPTDLGGLGMLSVGHSLIPARDLVYSKSTSMGVQFFYSGLTNADDIPIPNILQYYTPWETEVSESIKAWTEFSVRDREAKAAGTRLSIDDIEHIINKGVPRIRVLFSRHAKLFQFDKGFRCRMEFQRFLAGKYLKNWWFHPEHDGNICGGVLERYRVDMNIALGGVEAILEHSLFKGTGFPSWEGIEFNRTGGFENSKKDSKLARQQRAGLANVPNRRFALWWCPTINRSDVQAGFETKIDTTGVFMCGKLETIKKSLIKIFSGSLWEKCHGSVVNDIASKLKDTMVELDAASVTLQQQHPQKSYTYTSSAPDVIMVSTSRWPVTSKPTVLSDEAGDEYRAHSTAKFWFDIQLRWGNYDSHNIAEYARKRFYEYSSAKMYPFPAGVVVAVDLAYNCHSAFGYWVPRLKPLMMKLLSAIMRHNIALNTLRERMKRDLQLFSSAPTEAGLSVTNIAELFSEGMRTWIVDDSATYVTSEQPTAEGGRKFRSENGAVLLFEPTTGQLKLSIVHKSVFAGQKRRTKLAREKAAEEIASWLRSVPASQRPGKIIVTRSRFRQTLHNMLALDYPNIIVGQSDLNLAIPMVLRHSRLADLRISATESKGWEFCLYDDWLRQFQPATCFNLLNLILRGYHVNLSRTRETLEPDLHVEVHHSHFWPTYTREEWERISVRLQEMIIADAARRMNVSPNQFTEMEKKDILMSAPQAFVKPDTSQWKLSDLEMGVTLGTGSFGRVRVAKLKGTNDYYAVKCLKKHEIIKMKQVQHICQEKQLLMELSHPFIVNMLCSFQDDKRVYFVLEFVIGGEMFTHLRSAGRFPNDVAKFYHAELVLAFEYMHSKNIIYRDLKPENLLLDGKGHVKVTDFGFAKRVVDRTFTLCGTPEYLAPEVIQNKGHGKGVDWWTMGILLFEFIAGYPPFYDDTPFRTYEKILSGRFRFPSWFDSRARDLVKGLLQTDHTKRLGTLKGGVADVKSHPYFHGANWEKLYGRMYPAPIPVKVRNPGDTSNFERYPESEEDHNQPLSPAQQAEFSDF